MFDKNISELTQDVDQQYHVSKLFFDGVELLMPQNEIFSIESIYELELEPVQENRKHIGVIYRQGVKLPVYGFSGMMDILKSVPEDRFQCVVIRHLQSNFAILCNEIINVTLDEIDFQDIPDCMSHGLIPLTHLCLYKEKDNHLKLGLVTNADCLNKYISQKI